MNEFNSEDSDDFFQDGFDAKHLSYAEWVDYLRRCNAQVARFASIYALNRPTGKTLEEICLMAGANLDTNPECKEDFTDIEELEDLEYFNEPWTFLNLPLYVVSKAIFKYIDSNMARLLDEITIPQKDLWELSRSLNEALTCMTFAANAIDLCETELETCQYKMSSTALNALLARLDSISDCDSVAAKILIERMRDAVLDLRHMCIENNRKF